MQQQTIVSTTKGNSKVPLHFTTENIAMVKDLAASGLSHKQIAMKLSSRFVTAVKHKRLTAKTIANCLQAERYFSPEADRPKPVSKPRETPVSRIRDDVGGEILMLHPDEVQEILASNLRKDLKLKLVSSLIN